MKAPTVEVVQTLLYCPACGEPIPCALVVDPNLGKPSVVIGSPSGGYRPEVTVIPDPKVVGYAVSHSCGGAEPPPEPARNA